MPRINMETANCIEKKAVAFQQKCPNATVLEGDDREGEETLASFEGGDRGECAGYPCMR